MRAAVAHRLFTTVEYHRMGEAGILRPDDRVELLDGVIVRMTPIGSPHASCVNRLTALFTRCYPRLAITSVQNPIALDPRSEPQPDVVLLKPRADFYRHAHAQPADVLLVVEVMASSTDYDRVLKLPLYAAAGVVEVWLVDLAAEQVEVHRRPAGRAYAEVVALQRGQRLSPAALPRRPMRVENILGPRS
jgi:Uma2 family endonuclease